MKIKEMRINCKLTQASLAKDLGISQQRLSCIENNENKIDIDTLKKIAKYFNVTIDSILNDFDSKIDSEIDSKKEWNAVSFQYEKLNDENREVVEQLIRSLVKIQH